jgi:coenzyme F420-0:L-glutamate ligase/coenzyme F420-1:gamma-L-glutamate ligase
VIEVRPVSGVPEVEPGADLAGLIVAAAPDLSEGDILIVAQKAVSKAEGRLRRLADVEPTREALALVPKLLAGADARLVQVILDEAVRVVRAERVIIAETRHGYVCANAGVDHSNVPAGVVCLLPLDPDTSAKRLRDRFHELTGCRVGVIVSDTFGRSWRMGIANVALGVAGLPALIDYRGRPDDFGRLMTGTTVAVADELAAAGELVMGKTRRVPAAVIRGYEPDEPPGQGRDLVMPAELDLFR